MDFEGAIPPGEYSAGRVLIWDRGTYHCEIHGRYMLIKTNGRRWLMRRLDPPR